MLVRDIEHVFRESEQQGITVGPMALTKSALVHLCRRLNPADDGQQELGVLEFGGGQSTVFFSTLSSSGLLPVRCITLEHDSGWAEKLQDCINPSAIHLMKQTLKQVDHEGWGRMFQNPAQARAIWAQQAQAVPEEQYSHYTIRNTFYGEAHLVQVEPESVDVVILDGPHGNGRSLAFPLFAHTFKPGTLVLIDDFDHYPFLEDLGKLFQYEELYLERVNGKHWVLVRLIGSCLKEK